MSAEHDSAAPVLWYRGRDGRQYGPIRRDDFLTALRAGSTDLDTLVWEPGMSGWQRVADTPEILACMPPQVIADPGPRVPPHLAPPQAYRTPSVSEPPSNFAKQQQLWSVARPARRYLARWIDMNIAMFIAAVVLLVLAPDTGLVREHFDLTASLLGLALWVPCETVFLVMQNATPGKALLALRVQTDDGQPVGFRSALHRAAGVWGQGLVFGLPILNLFGWSALHDSLRRGQKSAWDSATGLTVLQRKLDPANQLGAIVVTVGLLVVTVAGASRPHGGKLPDAVPHGSSLRATGPVAGDEPPADSSDLFAELRNLGNVQTVEVRMIGDEKGYRFEPADIMVKQGDGIKFVMLSGGPHNFALDPATVPAAAALQLAANMPDQMAELSGTLLVNPNETYTVSFANVPPGKYEYYCVPHLAMGMKGTITVLPSE